ncbi:MAG: LysM peptidoglycan-binding domain-containing protein [Lewinellaceae bacterium]|nr:LysM peptidoglycan-binding domain-containing protein [Lewinellaceae bacterium]
MKHPLLSFPLTSPLAFALRLLPLFLLVVWLFAACTGSKSSRSTQPEAAVTTPRTGTTTPTTAYTPTGNVQVDYAQQYREAAVSEMQRTGIPASIKIAQGILESASGRSELASNGNNHFGIKCGSGWTGKTYHKKDDDRDAGGNLIESCFRKYSHPEESFFDHSEFIRDPRKSNRYGFLFNLDPRDYRSWARGLQSAGYATSPTYANQLIDLIERLRLYEFDQPGAVSVQPGAVIPASVPPSERIGRVNDVKVVNSREGESLADIARIYRLDGSKVADYNDRAYPPGQRIPAGTRIFIQEKKNSWRGQATHHFVRDRQTMLDIAQQYGIKIDKLLALNGLHSGQEPASNEKIRLRGKRQSNERIRLRNTDNTNDPAPADATSPSSMAPDENVIFDMTSDTSKTAKPATPPATIPGKPATTGVPYPSDPVPSTTTAPPVISTGTTTAPPPAPNVPAGYHQVVKGDTLYSLSRKYGIPVTRIKEMNNLPGDNIQIGQVLRVQ